MKKLMTLSVNILQPIKNRISHWRGNRINEKMITSKSKRYFHEAYIYNLKASRAIDRYEDLLRQTEKQIEKLQSENEDINEHKDSI